MSDYNHMECSVMKCHSYEVSYLSWLLSHHMQHQNLSLKNGSNTPMRMGGLIGSL